MSKSIIFLCLLISLINSKTVVENIKSYDPSEAIEALKAAPLSEEFYPSSITYLQNTIERYVFLDVIKNPPQPEGYPTYHNKVNLKEELGKIKTTETNFYDFYRDVVKVLVKPKDGHFRIRFNTNTALPYNFKNLHYLNPVQFYMKTNSTKIYATLCTDYDEKILAEIFGNATLLEEIKKKSSVEVTKINDLDPLVYIRQIRQGFMSFHSQDIVFTYNLRYAHTGQLTRYPLDDEELSPITVTYSDGEEIESFFKIIDKSSVMKYIAQNEGIDYDHFTESVDEMMKLKNYELADAIKQYKIQNKYEKIKNAIEWNYTLDDGAFKCRYDAENKLNVFYQNIFMVKDLNTYYPFVENCMVLFTKNTDPIVVIEDKNGGGMEEVTSSLQELIQPKLEIMNFNSFRYSEVIKKNLMMVDPVAPVKGSLFVERYMDLDTCKPYKTANELFSNITLDNFGDDNNPIYHIRSKESIIIVGESFRKKIDAIKDKMKNKKKPTEIIVFTDGFSFSATSFFIKALQEFGGAILVGYNGDPETKMFDAAQSPAGYLDNQYQDENILALKTLGYDVDAITTFESFSFSIKNPEKKYATPREFQIDPVDERTELYGHYTEDRYTEFMQTAKSIFDKYKTQCNPKNKRLMDDNKDCDSKLPAHTHGGYECGDDGKWTTTCKAYYCDRGYYFDSYKRECFKNPCANSSSFGLKAGLLLLLFIFLF